jgi:nicotinamidase-related amidase
MLVKGSEFLKHVSNAVASPDYKHVIFSRDYHPIGHSSFNGGAFTQYPQFFCTDRVCLPCDTPGQIPPSQQTGNFPPHCVQGFEGSKFHKEIVNIMKSSQAGGGGKKNIKRDAKRAAKIVEEAEKSKYEEWKQAAINEKVQILFKGMHKEVDSFTAVPKEKIDHLASDKNTEKNPCPNCKLITGGYRRVNGNLNTDIVFNFPVRNIDKDFFHYTQKEYETMFNGVSIIEVCGLAGDYCVRDTVVALAEMFPEKTIVLLGDFTRYACLPFYSMQVLPQHNYSESFIPFDTDDTKKQKIFNRVTSGTADTRVEKGIIYYIIKMLEDGKMQLMSADEINIEIKEKSKLFDFRNPTYQHFITPHKSIMRDYEKKNIHIEMTKPEILSSETSGAP